MNSLRNEDRIEEIWAEAFGPTPQVDFDRWCKQHPQAVGLLESSYGRIARQRRLRMIRITKMSTAALLMVGVSVAVFYLVEGNNGSIAFADVAEQLRQLKTASWNSMSTTTFTPAKDRPAPPGWTIRDLDLPVDTTRQWFYRAPNRLREEMTYIHEGRRHTSIGITDLGAGRHLLVDPIAKTATPYDRQTSALPGVEVWMRLKEKISQEAVPLGERDINGLEAVGFRLPSDHDYLGSGHGKAHTDVWVDPKSRDLLFIENTSVRELDWGTLKRVAVMRDFVFNQPLDDSLFSLTPPEGYQIKKPWYYSYGTTEEASVQDSEQSKTPPPDAEKKPSQR